MRWSLNSDQEGDDLRFRKLDNYENLKIKEEHSSSEEESDI